MVFDLRIGHSKTNQAHFVAIEIGLCKQRLRNLAQPVIILNRMWQGARAYYLTKSSYFSFNTTVRPRIASVPYDALRRASLR